MRPSTEVRLSLSAAAAPLNQVWQGDNILPVRPPNESFIFAGDDNKGGGHRVFKAFYEIEPNFAGRPIKDFENGADPPDILCRDFSGKRIGVELTEWLIGELVASGKARQRLQNSFSSVIRSDLEAPPRNIENVTVGLKSDTPPPASEQDEFRRELFECIRKEDATLPSTRSLQDCEQHDFPNHSILAKYVAWIRYSPLRPSERVAGIEWVRLPRWDRYYNPQEMFDRLLAIIGKKTRKYPILHRLQALDELYLIVFYSKGVLWNPPYNGFPEVADEVAARLQDGGPFQKIFLFSPAESGEKILQIWPRDTSP